MLPSFLRNLHLWFPGYLEDRRNRKGRAGRPCRVWLTIADHYEPCWRKAQHKLAMSRVRYWAKEWPAIARRHHDSAKKPAKYTFFFAEEEYHPELLAPLADLTRQGIADVEVHLHHDGEGQKDFETRIERFTDTLQHRHGLLREKDGKVAFGFIHGNWALGNSLPHGRLCGLNQELALLKNLGCYADFTLPSAPHAAQTALVNTIYWGTSDPDRPKAHNYGKPLLPGGPIEGDLLLIPGPLGLNFRGSGRIFPRLETGELAVHDTPAKGRARSWLELAPRIGDDIFLKLFTHGAQEPNAAMLLSCGLDECFDDLQAECDRLGHSLHFATAWEMWQQVEAVRTGRQGQTTPEEATPKRSLS